VPGRIVRAGGAAAACSAGRATPSKYSAQTQQASARIIRDDALIGAHRLAQSAACMLAQQTPRRPQAGARGAVMQHDGARPQRLQLSFAGSAVR
jgi:hypothetical protein